MKTGAAALSLSLLFFLLSLSLAQSSSIWYLSYNGSSDISTCGDSSINPCSSIELILNNITTTAETSGEGPCYNGLEEQVTTFIVVGRVFVPPVCFSGWSNLSITGYKGQSVLDSDLSGNQRGVLNIKDSHNVSITNIDFTTSIVGRATIYITNTSDVIISNVLLPIYSTQSNGILLLNAYNDVSISDVSFHGNDVFVSLGFQPAAALLIDQGHGTNGGIPAEGLPTINRLNLSVKNCSFTRLTRNSPSSVPTNNDYIGFSSVSQAVLIQLRQGGNDNVINFSGNSFQTISNPAGSVVSVRHSGTAANNSITFTDNHFTDNTARYGGGIAVYYLYQSHDNHVIIRNSVFTRTRATFEGGGVFVASIVSDSSNTISVEGCDFINTAADYGAGIFVFNDPNWFTNPYIVNRILPPLMSVSIDTVQFTDCDTNIDEGVMNMLNGNVNINGNNSFIGNNGSAIVLRSSVLVASGNYTFDHNKAESGGALKILFQSVVDLESVTNMYFTNNEARFAGGAVYADESSTTVPADVYNHTLGTGANGACFIRFPRNFGGQSLLYFSNNTASSSTSGNDFHIYNVRSCQQGYFFPPFLQDFVPSVPLNPIVIATDTPLLTTSTGPSYLFFYGSSSKCYKTVGGVVFHLPNCSNELLSKNFNNLPQLRCGIDRMINIEFVPYQGPGGGLHPTIDKLILPWASISPLAWDMSPGNERLNCPESSPSSITLSPAPGELFDITVQLSDQLLNYITSTIYIQIDHELGKPPPVLAQLNGIQYSYTDRIYFTPNRALSGLALVGLPGTEGFINVVSNSQIEGNQIILKIPFILSQCPLGYIDPPGASSIGEVLDLINEEYTTLQRIPSSQPLACQCYSPLSYGSAARFYHRSCINDYTIRLSSALWAGLIPINTSEVNELTTVSCPSSSPDTILIEDSLTSLINSERQKQLLILGQSEDPNANPVDVIPYNGVITAGGGAPVLCYSNYTIQQLVDFKSDGVFSVDYCSLGFCRGNSELDWYLSDIEYPCVETREGVLCGLCRSGLSQTVTTTVCRDCSSPKWYIPLLTTLIGGLLLVAIVTGFNIGVSPIFDVLLFFVQSVYVAVSNQTGYESFLTISIFNLDFTLDQCITSNLGALTRLLLQYATPTYILLLLLTIISLTKIKRVAKYFGQHSILHALWLLILISYLNIAKTTFEIVHCQYIGPLDDRRYVLVYDASIKCWSGEHLAWAIIAVLLAAFVILPFPFYVWLATQSYKLKPVSDVYTSIYKDSQRNWVVWNLLYRLLIVLVGVFVVNFFYRHFSLLLTFVIVLGIFVLFRPYHCSVDNLYGGFVAICLVIFSIVTDPFSYEYFDPHRVVSWLIMSVVLIIGGLLLALEGVLKYLRHKGKLYTKDDVLKSCKDRLLHLRDKLKKRRHSLLINASSSAPGLSQKGYMPFREPLIDSDQYIPSESQRNVENSRSIEFVENVKEGHVITTSVVSLTNSLV